LLSAVSIYVSYTYAQGYDCEGYSASHRGECYYQLLLKRWIEGADGQKQTPIDSAVRQSISIWRSHDNNKSPGRLKAIEDLERYRGLGIFFFDRGLLRQGCAPSNLNMPLRVDYIAIKMVKEYYKIDVDIETICRGLWNRWMGWNTNTGTQIGVRGLPDDEEIVFFISDVTAEILSTYRYKVKSE